MVSKTQKKMKKETITSIENELQPDGLAGYVFHILTGGNFDNLCDTAVLEEGACMVLKGSAPVRERREMFLKVYDGCKKIADHIKKDVEWKKP
jgi:hypothetical protein